MDGAHRNYAIRNPERQRRRGAVHFGTTSIRLFDAHHSGAFGEVVVVVVARALLFCLLLGIVYL